MRPASSSPPPTPWESLGYRNFHLAHLFQAMFRQRRRLAAWYPWVLVPPSRVGSPYGTGVAPYPAGALVRLWGGWDYLRGRCPACGGPVLGFAFAGGLSSGHVTGVCRRCATMATRFVWGIGTIMRCIRPVLEGTPFGLTGGTTPVPNRAPVALIAVLQELGESHLPRPDARGFRPRDPGQRGDVGSPSRRGRKRRKDSDTL
jgi:hypothetical protein